VIFSQILKSLHVQSFLFGGSKVYAYTRTQIYIYIYTLKQTNIHTVGEIETHNLTASTLNHEVSGTDKYSTIAETITAGVTCKRQVHILNPEDWHR
jgi:hypothetical protein